MSPAPVTLAVLRFAIAGLANTLVGLVVVVCTSQLFGLNAYAANAAGYASGLTFGYVLNRTWSFRDTSRVRITAPRYVLAFVLSYGANLLVLVLGTEILGWPELAAQAAALTTYSVAFFVLCRWFVFRNPAEPVASEDERHLRGARDRRA